MKTWLKGGLVGMAIPIIILIINLVFSLINDSILINIGLGNIFTNQFLLISSCSGESCLGAILWVPVIAIVEFFIIGAIIGFAIGLFLRKKPTNIRKK